MNVTEVVAEIAEKLDTIPGLRVFPYAAGKVPVPAAIVGLPDEIAFDQTFGRGMDAMTLPMWVLLSQADIKSATDRLADYLNGSGSESVKAAVDSTNTNTYSACDTVTITSAVVGSFGSGGVDYLGAEFTVQVSGSGS